MTPSACGMMDTEAVLLSSPARAFGMMGRPSQTLAGVPEGRGKIGAEGVSVGGTGVTVGVDVLLGRGVRVAVAVLTGTGVCIG